MDEQELIEDSECLGGLVIDKSRPPKPKGRSLIYAYSFPEQETKIKPGDNNIICLKTQTPVRELEIDEKNKLATFVMSNAKDMTTETKTIDTTIEIMTEDTITEATDMTETTNTTEEDLIDQGMTHTNKAIDLKKKKQKQQRKKKQNQANKQKQKKK